MEGAVLMTIRVEDKARFTPTDRSSILMPLSTDGQTDVLDCGGLALCGIEMSTGVAASLLSFNGSMSSTEAIQPFINEIGGVISLGSTSGMAGQTMVIDPPVFAAARYLQVATITTTGGTVAQSTSATLKLCLIDRS
jgi:hypothetical protein